MLHSITKENIYSACRSSDAMGCPEWLDELIDLGIAYLETDLEQDEWQEMCDKISKGDY